MSKPHLTLRKRNEQDHEISYLIKGLLPRKGLVVVVGKAGAGKTQVAMHAASSVAVGGIFGIFESQNKEIANTLCAPVNTGLTVYLVGEGKANIGARIKGAELALSVLDKDTLDESFRGVLPIIPITVDIPLDGLNQIAELDERIKEFFVDYPYLSSKPSLIVFDTLASIFPIKDENSNSEMQRVVNYLTGYADYYDCCVVVITHPPKSNDGPKGYSRGASALINSADVVLELERINASGQRTLTITKMRDGPYEGSKIYLQVKTFGSAPAIVPIFEPPQKKNEKKEALERTLTERQQQVLHALHNAVGKAMFQKVIAKAIFEGAQNENLTTEINKASHERMTRGAIDKLEKLGQLKVEKLGKENFITLLSKPNTAPELEDEDPAESDDEDQDDENELDEDDDTEDDY